MDLFPPESAEIITACCEDVIRLRKSIRREMLLDNRILHASFYPVVGAAGDVEGVAVFCRDITRRKRTEQKLNLSAKIVESSNEAIVITDVRGSIVEVNEAFCKLTGYLREEVLGQNPSMMKSGRHPPEFYRDLWSSLREKGQWQGEIWDRRKNGEIYPKLISISAVRDKRDRVTHYVGIFSDITRIKQTEKRLQHLAHFDPLTHLPNRLLFRDRLQRALLEARQGNTAVALMLLDLDRFKDVNDTLGHQAGDELLVEVAKRLTECLRKTDTVARLGGDEFSVVLPGVANALDVVGIARNIIEDLGKSFQLAGRDVVVTTSIGVTLYPEDSLGVDRLLQNADLALYHAKANGRNNFQFFSEGMNREIIQRVQLEQDLRRGLTMGEFSVYYQPQLHCDTGHVTGLEALLRWHNPQRGVVTPGSFISVAEETGLIAPIGEWVLYSACKQAKAWQDAGLPPLPIAVNVSARQMERINLVHAVTRALEDTGLEARWLELELTESLAMKDPNASIELFSELKAKGVRIAIDDFGTGYSSLSYLNSFPIDKLKIDKSFVDKSAGDQDQGAIVKAIVAVAKSLKLQVLAEGVETTDQLKFLREQGCDEWQGYLFSRPVPADQIPDLLKARFM